MREIVLDTETTGLDPIMGDRIVEIGAVELLNSLPTGKIYHQYINPECPMPAAAFAVHGLSDDFLSPQPRFAEIAPAFLEFIEDSRLIIHNAEFDMKFLNAELSKANYPVLPASRALDSLAMARKKYPGSPASLDALCRRFGIDNSKREKHGALLDSEILAEVYLHMIGGLQPNLMMATRHDSDNKVEYGVDILSAHEEETFTVSRAMPRARTLPPRLSESELANHEAMIATLGSDAIWKKIKKPLS